MLGYRECWDGGRGLGGKFQARVNSLELRLAETAPKLSSSGPCSGWNTEEPKSPGRKEIQGGDGSWVTSREAGEGLCWTLPCWGVGGCPFAVLLHHRWEGFPGALAEP